MTEYVCETAGTTTRLGRRVHSGWDVTDCSEAAEAESIEVATEAWA